VFSSSDVAFHSSIHFSECHSGQLQELRAHYQIRQTKEESMKADIIQVIEDEERK